MAWENPQSAFEDKGLYRRLSLFRALVRMRLENLSSMDAHMNEVMSISQKLSDIDSPIDNEFLGVILLSGLTSEYDPMVMAIKNSGQKISSESIKSKLLLDNKFDSKDQHEDSALLSL
ncbi:hypothetical protein JTB14_021875 [Gonioctena quinquepunctata]|nr:hypothetical protein JTB14_021875 [Gonioctena quinquepunctata]